MPICPPDEGCYLRSSSPAAIVISTWDSARVLEAVRHSKLFSVWPLSDAKNIGWTDSSETCIDQPPANCRQKPSRRVQSDSSRGIAPVCLSLHSHQSPATSHPMKPLIILLEKGSKWAQKPKAQQFKKIALARLPWCYKAQEEVRAGYVYGCVQ